MNIPDPLVKLDYNPALDILIVEWPDFRQYSLYESVYVLDKVIETIRHYDVKYLLTDTRYKMVDISDSEYKKIILKFALGLETSRLQKLARIVTESTLRERTITEVKQEVQLTIPLKNFFNKKEAVNWLISKN